LRAGSAAALDGTATKRSYCVLAARRGVALAIVGGALLALPFLPFYVGASPALLGVGAFATGAFGAGLCGVVPMLLTDLFPAETRAKSIGLVYHVGSAVAAFVPMSIVAVSHALTISLGHAMALVAGTCLIGVSILVVLRASTRRATSVAHAALLALGLFGCSVGSDSPERSSSTASALSPVLEEVTSFGSNPGGLKMYRHSPAGIGPNAPLVVALHGCTQTAADYANVGWNEIADKLAFHVVYAEQSTKNSPTRCFTWYGAGLVRGQGENLSIKQMVDTMKSQFHVDPKRIFITGL
jgi:hypothetical protein